MAWYNTLQSHDFADSIIDGTLSELYCNNVSFLGYGAMQRCFSLTNVSFPFVTSMGGRAFRNVPTLETAAFPRATSIGEGAFENDYHLISIFLTGSSICTLLSSNVFASTPIGGYSTSAKQYGTIYVPSSLISSYKTATNWARYSSRFSAIEDYVTDLNSTFYKVTNLSTDTNAIDAKFLDRTVSEFYFNSTVTSVRSCAFDNCSNLTGLDLPNVSIINEWGIQSCSSLSRVFFSNLKSTKLMALGQCRNLEFISAPNLSIIGQKAFYNCCYKLSEINFPNAYTMSNEAFCYCSKITTAYFPKLSRINGSRAFYQCLVLSSFFLTGSSRCTLEYRSAFAQTPFYNSSSTAYFYVPSSLIDSYKTATNWAYFSSRFSAIQDYVPD